MAEDTSHDVSRSAGHVPRKDSYFLLSRYWLLFVITLVSTSAFSYYRIGTHTVAHPPSAVAGDKDHTTLLTEITRLSAYVSDNLHQAPPIVEAAVQMGLVVLVTWLWFYTFRAAAQLKTIAGAAPATNAPTLPWYLRLRLVKAKGGPIPIPLVLGTISTVPALVFVSSMYQAYQPAVFVMALVAVFVAAEHYGGLREQGEQLTEQLTQLTRQRIALETTRSDLDETLHSLRSIQRATETLLNFEGMERFKADMYDRYAHAGTEIAAVVRFHDIDSEWWECGLKPEPVWDTYLERYLKKEVAAPVLSAEEQAGCADAARSQGRPTLALPKSIAEGTATDPRQPKKVTLLEALTSPTYLASTDFVSDLPLPLSREWHRRLTNNDLFRDLLGMTWQLVVLEQARSVRAQRNKTHSVGPLEAKRISAYVGCPSSWMHVVDSTVFQVIWRDKRKESSVRELTVDIKLPELRHTICEWAHDDIQRYVARASRAEEYIVAVLRFAAFQMSGMRQIVEDQVFVEEHELSDVLDKLGMSEWLKDAVELNLLGDRRIACGKELCVSVFRRFLLQRWKDLSVSVSPSVRDDEFRFRHLTLETL